MDANPHQELTPERLQDLFPNEPGIEGAVIIHSAEGVLDLSSPDDPDGVELTAWLERVRGNIDKQLAALA